jgi:hypothetical protein
MSLTIYAVHVPREGRLGVVIITERFARHCHGTEKKQSLSTKHLRKDLKTFQNEFLRATRCHMPFETIDREMEKTKKRFLGHAEIFVVEEQGLSGHLVHQARVWLRDV